MAAASELAEWLERQRTGGERLLIGICGPPGCGKSTLAAQLERDVGAVVVPMDGFHLPNDVLHARGSHAVKGAPHTFDADAFVTAVRALRRADAAVRLPSFDRTIDEPVADAIVVPASAPIVVVEGNYLLLGSSPWSALRGLLDAVAYVDLDDDVRIARLIARHERFGRTAEQARDFVRRSDARNAALVADTRRFADVVIVND